MCTLRTWVWRSSWQANPGWSQSPQRQSNLGVLSGLMLRTIRRKAVCLALRPPPYRIVKSGLSLSGAAGTAVTPQLVRLLCQRYIKTGHYMIIKIPSVLKENSNDNFSYENSTDLNNIYFKMIDSISDTSSAAQRARRRGHRRHTRTRKHGPCSQCCGS
jgi:hypothetical protein